MAQPTEEGAAGGSNETVEAPELSIEDRFGAALGIEDEEPEPEEEAEDAPQEDEPEAEAGEEDEPEAETEEIPSIDAPVSWTAEEKEEFAKLPPALQTTITRREAEREKFVQSKAQEAKATRSQVEQEAFAYIEQVNSTHAQALIGLKVQVPNRPSAMLQVEDPYAYAEQMDQYERSTAHNQWIEQNASAAIQQAQQAQQAARTQSVQATNAVLAERFPEFLDPVQGPKLKQELGSIALALGYSEESLKDVDHTDILAMREVANLKAKADKYDALMAQKMQKVREAKDMPKVSRPGVSTPKGTQDAQRYAADRKAMRSGNRDAASRVFERFV